MPAADVLQFLREMIATYGYVVVFLGAALDNTGVPASGDFTLLAAGFLASEGELSLALCMIFAGFGALLGDNVAYWAGRLGGQPVVWRLVRFFRLTESKLQAAEAYFGAHGGKTVFIGRFLPTLRSLSPLFAGVGRMSYPRFVFFNLAGVSLWAILAGTVGYLFGAYWEQLLTTWRTVSIAALVAVLVIVSLLLIRAKLAARRGS